MKPKNDWHTHFKEFKHRYPFGIKCPYCSAKHYWNRAERIHLDNTGEVPVECCCGGKYKIVLNNDGAGVHIRAERKENVEKRIIDTVCCARIGSSHPGDIQHRLQRRTQGRLPGREERKVIKAICDRCGEEMDINGKIGYLSWTFKDGVDGDIKSDNPLENCHFCGECMEAVMNAITEPAKVTKKEKEPKKKHAPKEKTTRPEVKREPKGRITDGGKMWALKEAGWSNAQIADEFGVSQQAVANWFSKHKEQEAG